VRVLVVFWTLLRRENPSDVYLILVHTMIKKLPLSIFKMLISEARTIFKMSYILCGSHAECPATVSHTELGHSLNGAGQNEVGWTDYLLPLGSG
jgi:hypothetical protein